MDPNQTSDTQPPVQEVPSTVRPPQNDVAENKDLAALSYVWILSVFLYFWKKESPFVQFHAKQGIVLFILSTVVWFIPFVNRVLELIVLALCVLGFLAAAQGLWKDLPIIGDIANGRWSHVRKSWQDIVASIVSLWQRVRKSGNKKKEDVIIVPPSTPSTENPNPNPNPHI